ncbi:tetratricopeptide repeat protein [Amycolatopsis sp. NPDC051102]|uniref:ATP-binding protein n=1 Tax=Amycolatopsis sp. NPDC051102 TaxID=3155163 RepID=UPI00341B267E
MNEPVLGNSMAGAVFGPVVQASAIYGGVHLNPAVASAMPHQLPPDIADFTGREAVLGRLTRLLTARRHTAVVVSAINGKGGVGKTALAIHAGHLLRDHFPDGHLYVNLRGAEAESRNPATVLVEFLRALGVPGEALPDTVEECSTLYRSKLHGLRVLVVLDNAENEAQVRPLLPGSPTAAVVVTSRRRMTGLEGATGLPLDVLDEARAVDLLARIAGDERVAADSAAAGRIVRLCGCLPLAIRIAGAKIAEAPHRTLEAIEGRLRDEHRRLDELVAGDLEVRASLALSYLSCPERERRLFSLLGCLRSADFPVWVAAALLEVHADEAEDALDSLVRAQLLDVDGDDAVGQARYRFHDLIRDYSRDTLQNHAAHDRDAAFERVLRGYRDLTRTAEAHADARRDIVVQTQVWISPDQPVVAAAVERPVTWYSAERRSVLSIATQALETMGDATAVELVIACQGLFEITSDWTAWEHTHEMALPVAGDRPLLRAHTLYGLGTLHWDKAQWASAQRFFAESLQIFTECREDHWRARVLHSMGGVLRDEGRLTEALDLLAQADTMFVRDNDELWHARTLRRMGGAYWDAGELTAATQSLEASLPILRNFHDVRWEARGLRTLGGVYTALDRIDDAVRCLDACITTFRRLGDELWVARSLRTLGQCHARQANQAKAERCFRAALKTFGDLGDTRYEALSRLDLAELAAAHGNPDSDRTSIEEALVTLQHYNDTRSIARCQALLSLPPQSDR